MDATTTAALFALERFETAWAVVAGTLALPERRRFGRMFHAARSRLGEGGAAGAHLAGVLMERCIKEIERQVLRHARTEDEAAADARRMAEARREVVDEPLRAPLAAPWRSG